VAVILGYDSKELKECSSFSFLPLAKVSEDISPFSFVYALSRLLWP
jgi:hypothetical protein